MLDTTLTDQLTTHFEKITRPVRLVASLDDGPKSNELAELLDQLASLSPAITVDPTGDDERRPSFSIQADDVEIDIRFAGIPMGHEFTSLVLALLHVGGHPPAADDELIDQIRHLDGEYRFETYVSLSCQNCPDVVQALNLMSVVNPNVSHVMIDGALFPDEVEARSVRSVPAVFLDGEPFDQGRMSLGQILARLDDGAADRTAERLDEKDPFDVLIIGGGPAGASAAVYAARKNLRTGLLAERFGGQLLDTLGIENLISTPYTEGPQLAAELEHNVRSHDVDVITDQRAARLRRGTGAGDLIDVELASGATLRARTVVLATGARWRQMEVPGEQEYANRGVAYCPHCDGPLYRGKRVAVVGGGNSGVEAAIDLAGIADHVTLIEWDERLRADFVLQQRLGALANVEVLLSTETASVHGDDDGVTGLTVADRASGAGRDVDVDGVFVQIGLLPNTEWLAGAIELSERGEIVVDEGGRTSMPGVFAAGDCTTEPFKQIVVAMGAGSTAMLSAFDHLMRQPVGDRPDADAPAAAA